MVTVVFNDRENILKTIQNVDSQTARANIEYIVVDGASTDGTSEIIRANGQKIDRYICEPDSGIYNAMNKGLALASGQYIIFINSGDCFSSADTVELIISALAQTQQLPAVVYGNYRERNAKGCYSSPIPARRPQRIWYGPVASHQSTFYNVGFLRENNLSYDESYRIAADYRLTLQCLRLSNCSALKTDICISDFDTSGVSNQNQDLGLDEANRARREVLGWGKMRAGTMKMLLLSARYSKRFAGPLYRKLRQHI